MQRLYCPECGEYLEGGDGSMRDCYCGWMQPQDRNCETAEREEDCEMFTVGQRVKAKTDLGEAACGDHPALLYASKGEELIVRDIDDSLGYPVAVSHEHITDKSFRVALNEIEAV